MNAKDLIEQNIIPALNRVGELFETRKDYFLPQLVASAEAAKAAFSLLENKSGETNKNKPAVIMATVKGDMHDIGKNIVCLVLGNHGYRIVDLGKDVDAQTIVEAVKRENAAMVGLSALITTTMIQMPVVISAFAGRRDTDSRDGGRRGRYAQIRTKRSARIMPRMQRRLWRLQKKCIK